MSDNDYVQKMKENLAVALMVRNGWKLEEMDEYAIEWDPNREDSQYAMMIDEANYTVDAVLSMINDLTEEEEEEEETQPTNTTTAALFIFMDAGTGNPRYVKDVRDWLAKVDAARIPDDTEIEGTLHLSYDVNLENIERIECLDCGEKDLLLTMHKCNT